jgi:hypothetical protein
MTFDGILTQVLDLLQRQGLTTPMPVFEVVHGL